MIIKPKNCINCTFCLRNQETWCSGHALYKIPGKWINDVKSLDLKERDNLKKGDSNFLGAEIRKAEEWQKEYDMRDARMKKKNPLFNFSHRLIEWSGSEAEKERRKNDLERVEMDEKPESPDYDYLSCYHEQWEEDKERKNPINPNFLKKKKCHFYFPFKKMENQTLEACEKSRIHIREKTNFWVTNILVIIGTVATIFFGFWSPKNSSKDQPTVNRFESIPVENKKLEDEKSHLKQKIPSNKKVKNNAKHS